MKNISDNGRKWFPLARNQFALARISYVFKDWFPLIAVMVSASREKFASKVTVSIREKKSSPIAGIKNLFKNLFSLIRKKVFAGLSLLKNIKNGFY